MNILSFCSNNTHMCDLYTLCVETWNRFCAYVSDLLKYTLLVWRSCIQRIDNIRHLQHATKLLWNSASKLVQKAVYIRFMCLLATKQNVEQLFFCRQHTIHSCIQMFWDNTIFTSFSHFARPTLELSTTSHRSCIYADNKL